MDHRDAAAPTAWRAEPLPGPGGRGQGPRQEYLDAFDDRQIGRAIPEQRRPEGREGRPRTQSGGRHASPRKRGSVLGDRRRRRSPGGWGRTLSGMAAAAVVTVLGIAVAVRVADPGSGGADVADAEHPAPEGQAGGGAAEPDTRPRIPGDAPPERGPAPEPTYEELLGQRVEMAADLDGSGELVPVGGSEEAANPDATTLVRYRVDVEEGLGVDPEFFAEAVQRTLNDSRGWGNRGERSFARVSGGDHDFVVTLASPGTAADWCAMSGLDITEDNVSCNSSSTERVIINAWRWAQGSETYGDDIAGYRQMLINHEVGHRLGYGHVTCPAEGEPAPVMMQQTKFLETEGVTCLPNPWPHPGN
ncbi:DUF3152 domain-containing protein [Streptomyces sp. PT12]|uniref:DUF3152 domain-containing protein n=1 Tax=Streptomyces sp. PT12 TaxID=1510197 RepID=UPI000DE25ADC|nr:DUF3152 domain-containing protein [Streptomyces sp. PT12]RBM11878.1 hypothetical protein DEH69_21625 [Streptomyces sp. PT12]